MVVFPGAEVISFIFIFLLFFIMQKLLHREIQYIFLIIFRNPTLVIALFSLLLLPGVIIHEVSHLLSAIILRVKVIKFSIVPRSLKNGQLRMGYVETKRSDFIRDSIIGIAPLITGLLLVAYIANNHLGLKYSDSTFMTSNVQSIFPILENFMYQNDLGIWLYLCFCISSTMIPSASDRQSWKNVIFGIAIIIIILVLFGTGDWLINTVSLQLERWLIMLTFIIFISLLIHLVIFIPLLITRFLISRATGLQVLKNRS